MNNNEMQPKETGYKVINAVLYVFHYLFFAARRDVKAFVMVVFY